MCAPLAATRTVTPIPLETEYVLVSNLCPECQWGDFDFESAGDGRWGIEWCAGPSHFSRGHACSSSTLDEHPCSMSQLSHASALLAPWFMRGFGNGSQLHGHML